MPRIRINYDETKIPKEHQRLYGYLSGALTETYESLRAVEKLYMNDAVVARLNSAAPEFFALVRQLLIHNIILCIARLTDRPRTFWQENLTLSRLLLELSYNPEMFKPTVLIGQEVEENRGDEPSRAVISSQAACSCRQSRVFKSKHIIG